jgi:hypothetical protein
MTRYAPAHLSDYTLIQAFRHAFVSQNQVLAEKCFAEESSFGIHLGMRKDAYIAHEMKEFKEKCEKFGLSEEGPLKVWRISEQAIYFCFGNEKDEALFEAVWDVTKEGELVGNQSEFRWEPKVQCIQNGLGNVAIKRVCNTKRLYGETNLHSGRFLGVETPDAFSIEEKLEPIMGGDFLTFGYTEESSMESHWGYASVRSHGGQRSHQHIWLRGADHPMFQSDMWPVVDWGKNRIQAPERLRMLVILSVTFEDGEVRRWKYPEEMEWRLEKSIKEVCLTDGLSTDWIIRRRESKNDERGHRDGT